jgi:hypothetical protein
MHFRNSLHGARLRIFGIQARINDQLLYQLLFGALSRISCIQARMWPEPKVGVLFDHCLKEKQMEKQIKSEQSWGPL